MTDILFLDDLELPGAEVYYIDNFVDDPQTVYEKLHKEIPWKQEKAIVFGKEFNQRRLSCFLGDPEKTYKYAGITRSPERLTSTLNDLMDSVQKVVDKVDGSNQRYTSVLANYYRDGNDSIGAHSDDEKDLAKDSIIASLSLGAERFFDIYSKDDGKKIKRIKLSNGSLLLMGKNMQKLYKHAVPVQKTVKEGRINLTWRIIK